MSELAQLTRRVTRLEERMDDVQDLARRTGEEVADWRTTLNLHTKTLNAMGEKIDLFQKRVDKRFAEVDERLDKFEAKVEEKFALLHQGQVQITELLTRHLGEPDEEPRAGGTDE